MISAGINHFTIIKVQLTISILSEEDGATNTFTAAKDGNGFHHFCMCDLENYDTRVCYQDNTYKSQYKAHQ